MAKLPQAQRPVKGRVRSQRSRPQRAHTTEASVLNVFLSYKTQDSEIAKRLRTTLESFGRNWIEVFYAERLSPGEKWSEAIHQQLQDCDCLLVLYTDPAEHWDWCMYEAGYFRGFQRDGRPLYCLHPECIPRPGPLQDHQSVPATREKVKNFLGSISGLILADGETLESKLHRTVFEEEPCRTERLISLDSEWTGYADEIVSLVSVAPTPKEMLWQTPQMFLTISREGRSLIERGEIPTDAVVELTPTDKGLFVVRRTGPIVVTWSEFLALFSEENKEEFDAWAMNLAEQLRNAASPAREAETIPPARRREGEPPFFSCIYGTELLTNDCVRFHVTFFKEPFHLDWSSDEPRESLFQVLWLAKRFHFELIKSFRLRILQAARGNGDAKQSCMEGFAKTILLIRWAARHRRIVAIELVNELLERVHGSPLNLRGVLERFKKALQESRNCTRSETGDIEERWAQFVQHHSVLALSVEILVSAVAYVYGASYGPPSCDDHDT
jgi:hypothetical protein